MLVIREQNYSQQEKRQQLEQNVIRAVQALEEAERQKEDSLQEAARVLEDAKAALDAVNVAVNTLALEVDELYRADIVKKLQDMK